MAKLNKRTRIVSEVQQAPVVKEAPGGVELRLTPTAAMYINTGNSQNQGARPYQEDAFGYSNIVDGRYVSERGMIAILSDGMGGLSDGKNVANYVVQASISMFESIDPRKNISQQLKNIATYINDNVANKYNAEGGRSKAGATMVLAYIYKNRIYWVVVGDSRLYCLRGNKFMQMNEDHDYKNLLLRRYLDEGGSITDADQDPQKDSLVSFIGKSGMPGIDVSLKGYRIEPNDVFVLCSDGIYNGISEDVMKEIILQNDAQTASEKIVSSVVQARHAGQDNMTVMVIKCVSDN